MDALFNSIVRLLNYWCARTGLSYEEINILIYGLLIPASWYLIVWVRRKKGFPVLLVHLALPVVYFAEKQHLAGFSEKFYAANIRALELLGARWGTGYVVISVLIGVAVPFVLYGLLICAPKKWLTGLYAGFMGINLLYYAWVLGNF